MPRITNYKNIAIIQTAFIGDVALTLHLAQAIKTLHPSSNLIFVTTPQSESLACCSNAVDEVIVFDKRHTLKGWKGIKHIVNCLKAAETDCIITPHRSLRSTLITMLSRPRISVGFNKNALSFLYKHRVHYEKYIHETSRNLSLLSVFDDVVIDDSSINSINSINNINQLSADIVIPDEDIKFASRLLGNEHDTSPTTPLIAIAPGSVWETKKWGKDNYIDLCKAIIAKGIRLLLIGSEGDAELCKEIASKSGASSLAGKTSLPQTLYILQKVSLTVTNDSAPTHLAELAGSPVITIFGPTVPEFGFAPQMILSSVVQVNGLECRPCAIHGSRKCPTGTHECMQKIDHLTVLAAIEATLLVLKKTDNI